MISCKESNKLSGTENFRAWKIRTDLNLIESEVMDSVKGSHVERSKENIQAYTKYTKGEIIARKILIESLKDSIIPYVSNLESSKEIYDKLVELLSISIAGEIMSLRK